jgi:AhpD family alkylhydroperoxidase
MKTTLVLSTILALGLAGVAHADLKPATTTSRATATLTEIEKTIGFVPGFFKVIPGSLLPSFWDAMVSFEDSPDTKLDGKTKQLIALAVAAQVPCDYCTYYHTEAARAHGATEQELQEAVAMAAGVRQGSTFMNGMQLDKTQFKRDVDRVFRAVRQAAKKK